MDWNGLDWDRKNGPMSNSATVIRIASTAAPVHRAVLNVGVRFWVTGEKKVAKH